MRKILLTLFILSILAAAAMAQPYGYRYWIDNDVSTATTGSTTGEAAFNVSLSQIPIGLHALHVEAWNGDGRSSVRTRYFMKEGPVTATTARYWLDNDMTTLHNGVATSGVIELDLSGLDSGLHCVHYQTIGANGAVSATRTRYFLVNPVEIGALTASISIDGGEPTIHQVTGDDIIIDIGELEGEHQLCVILYDESHRVVGIKTMTFDATEIEPELVHLVSYTGSNYSYTIPWGVSYVNPTYSETITIPLSDLGDITYNDFISK